MTLHNAVLNLTNAPENALLVVCLNDEYIEVKDVQLTDNWIPFVNQDGQIQHAKAIVITI